MGLGAPGRGFSASASLHVSFAETTARVPKVVRAATKPQIFRGRRTAASVRVDVIELKKEPSTATTAIARHEGALPVVSGTAARRALRFQRWK